MKHHLKLADERSANEDRGRWVEESEGRSEDGRLLASVLSSALEISTSAHATLSTWATSLCYVINSALHGGAS